MKKKTSPMTRSWELLNLQCTCTKNSETQTKSFILFINKIDSVSNGYVLCTLLQCVQQSRNLYNCVQQRVQ